MTAHPHTGGRAAPDTPRRLAVARALELRHGSRVAVRPSDFILPAERLIAVIGPNGSGKSTLLTALAGLSTPASGQLEVLGEDPRRRSHRSSFVMQSLGVPQGVPVTVRDVVGMGRYPARGWFRPFRREDRDIVRAAMDRLQVSDLARRHLDQLSGGQRQRAYVAQGLAQDHDVLLLDEPMTGLDIVSARTIDDLLHEEPTRGVSVVYTTHDLDEAAEADHVVLMSGRVVASGPPAEVLTVENLDIAYGRGALHGPSKVVEDAPGFLDDPAGGPRH